MRVVGICALCLTVCALLGAVRAGDDGKKGKDIDAIFKKLDVNMDGKLSKDEFLKSVRHEATQLAAKRYIVDEDIDLLVENAAQRYDAAMMAAK